MALPKASQLIFAAMSPQTNLDPLSFISSHGQDKLTLDQIRTLDHWHERLNQGEPLQHILGRAQFGDLTLKTDSRALIPRQETEELIVHVIRHLESTRDPVTIADIGTGAGPIALSLAQWLSQHNHGAKIIATDISQDALELASDNFKNLKFLAPRSSKSGVGKIKNSDVHISFRQGSLLMPLDEPVDVIVANLPYIPSHWLEKIDKSVVDYEPLVALDGGTEGLDLITEMLADAPRVLKPGGKIFLEIWHEHTPAHFETFSKFETDLKYDSFGRMRFAVMQLRKP